MPIVRACKNFILHTGKVNLSLGPLLLPVPGLAFEGLGLGYDVQGGLFHLYLLEILLNLGLLVESPPGNVSLPRILLHTHDSPGLEPRGVVI